MRLSHELFLKGPVRADSRTGMADLYGTTLPHSCRFFLSVLSLVFQRLNMFNTGHHKRQLHTVKCTAKPFLIAWVDKMNPGFLFLSISSWEHTDLVLSDLAYNKTHSYTYSPSFRQHKSDTALVFKLSPVTENSSLFPYSMLIWVFLYLCMDVRQTGVGRILNKTMSICSKF